MREGWKYKKLGDICESDLGKTLNQSKDDGEMCPYLCAINVQWDKIDLSTLKTARFTDIEQEKYSVRKGDLLICEGGDIGRAAIWDRNTPFQYQNALHRVRFNGPAYYSRFYLLYLLFLKNKGILDTRYGKGVTIQHLVKSSLLSIYVPVPPLPEQERIVAEFDLLTGIIDKQKAQMGELDTLAQSIFYDMFGDPIENEKGWATKQLRTIIQVKGRVGWKGYKKEDLRDSGPLAIGGGHITDSGEIDLSNPVFLSQEKYEESPEIMIETGDLILVQRGTIGKVGLIKYDIGQATINPCVLILRPYSINNVYALHFFLSKSIQECLKKLVRGVAQPMITQQQVNSIEIPVPPLLLQQSFAQKIQSIESQKESINRSIAETQKLFDYTMDKYFG